MSDAASKQEPDGGEVRLVLTQESEFRFTVDFTQPGIPDLHIDEPAPIGSGDGPSPPQLLAAAVGGCLSASLFFCMRKFKQEAGPLRTEITARMTRNEAGHVRVGELSAVLHLGAEARSLEHFERCARRFEDYCVVTQSVRDGVDVKVAVVDVNGAEMYRSV